MKNLTDKWVAGRDHLDCTLSCRNTDRDAMPGNPDDATGSSVEIRIDFPDEVGEHEVAVHCPICGSDEIKAKVMVKDRAARMRPVREASLKLMGISAFAGAWCVWGLFSEPDQTTWAWLLPVFVLMLAYSFLEILGKGALSRAAAVTEGLTGHTLDFKNVGRRHKVSTR